MARGKFVGLSGSLVPHDEANISVFASAVRFAAHLFEGVRAYWNDEREELHVFHLDEHVRRLRSGMKLMRYDPVPSSDEIVRTVLDCVRANGHREDVGIRLSAYVLGEGFIDATGPVALMCSTEVSAKKTLTDKKVRALVTSWQRINDNVMPGRLKCAANYQNSRLGLMQARDAGFDEAIFLGADGKVAGGAAACLFMIRDGRPVTPPITAGILESVTRETLMHLFAEQYGLQTVERQMDRSELYMADEVHPIVNVDGIGVGDSEIGPLTAGVWDGYEALVRGRATDHADWRTPVYGGQ